MSWRPALTGDDRELARARVRELIGQLDGVAPKASLANGLAGIALLHSYRAACGDRGAKARAFDAAAQALEHVDSNPTPWLFAGYAGIGFVLAHCAASLGDIDSALQPIDRLIGSVLAAEPWPHEWELMSGLIGLGVFALERGNNAMIERVVRHLDSLAETRGDGITWRRRDEVDGSTYYNLGIAHGVAGAIGFLAEVCARPVRPARAEPLLRGAIAWLRAHERPTNPAYPMAIDYRSQGPLLLDGWCYGDASMALVIYRAGVALGEAEWRAAASALAIRAARRSAAELARLAIDASFCHGAIGQAHIFHRLGTALDDAELVATAVQWYRRSLARRPLREEGGAGLLTGLAGIALALRAGFSDAEPSWDRAFLLR